MNSSGIRVFFSSVIRLHQPVCVTSSPKSLLRIMPSYLAFLVTCLLLMANVRSAPIFQLCCRNPHPRNLLLFGSAVKLVQSAPAGKFLESEYHVEDLHGCEITVDEAMRFSLRPMGWRHRDAVFQEKFFTESVLKSREAATCLTDEEYVARIAEDFFLQYKQRMADRFRTVYMQTIVAWNKGEVAYKRFGVDGNRELKETDQLVWWYVTFLDAIVGRNYPYLLEDGSSANRWVDLYCYLPYPSSPKCKVLWLLFPQEWYVCHAFLASF